MLITLSHLDLVVAGGEVDLAEHLGTLEAIHQVVDPRQWVAVLDCDGVEEAIVNHHPAGAVLLGYEQHGRSVGRGARGDEAPVDQVL